MEASTNTRNLVEKDSLLLGHLSSLRLIVKFTMAYHLMRLGVHGPDECHQDLALITPSINIRVPKHITPVSSMPFPLSNPRGQALSCSYLTFERLRRSLSRPVVLDVK